MGVALGVGLVPNLAGAVEYEIFIDVQDEDDLFDLNTTGQISDQTFQDLQDLLRRGIDLNHATREELYSLPNLTYADVDRILLYREEVGQIIEPAALVTAGVLSERTMRSIAVFLELPSGSKKRIGVHGYARYQTIWTVEDERVPPMALEGRVTLNNLTMGAALLLDRNRLGPVTYDPNRNGLVTEGEKIQVRPAKYFAMWDTERWGVIAGTYSVGFGQRLTFDTTGRYTPNGFYFDNTIYRSTDLTSGCRSTAGEGIDSPCTDEDLAYVTPDFRFSTNLRGVAAGFRDIQLPKGSIQGYGFFSYQTRDVWQYGLYRPDLCDDPHQADNVACQALPLYKRTDDPYQPTSGFRSTTMPNLYNEILGGANLSYFYNRRIHVGVTGYGAAHQFLLEGVEVDLQDSERSPYGGPFGAVGADAAWGRGWADLFVEVAYSFDNMTISPLNTVSPKGGGGPAAIVRHTATWGPHELEIAGRYYDLDYANPYARSISASDEVDGLRARGEAGGRVRYNGTLFDRWSLRAFADVWVALDDNVPRLRAYMRNDVQALTWLRPGFWIDYQNQDLAHNGRSECYTGDENDDFDREPVAGQGLASDAFGFEDAIDCRGERVKVTGRLRFDPHRRVSIQMQYDHTFRDADGAVIEYTGSVGDFSIGDFGNLTEATAFYDANFRQDVAAFILISTNPIDRLRLRGRVRWQIDELEFNDRGEQTLWVYVQGKYRVRRWFQPSLRYDLRQWLDDRDSTVSRRPNPEHWLRFEIESRF